MSIGQIDIGRAKVRSRSCAAECPHLLEWGSMETEGVVMAVEGRVFDIRHAP